MSVWARKAVFFGDGVFEDEKIYLCKMLAETESVRYNGNRQKSSTDLSALTTRFLPRVEVSRHAE